MNELIYHDSATFVTLTFDDEHLPDDYSISKRELQLFMKRFRKEYGKPVRFFASGEYGTKGERWVNPHYHLVIFGVDRADPVFQFVAYRKSKRGFDGIQVKLESWNKGDVYVGDVTYDSACYVAKYTSKKLLADEVVLPKEWYLENCLEPPFLLMSRKPGIGAKYADSNQKRIIKRGYLIGKNGSHVAVPRFYKDRLGIKKSPDEYLEDVRKQVSEYYDRSKTGKSYFTYIAEVRQNAVNLVKSIMKRKNDEN